MVKKEVFIGMFAGIIATLIGTLLYVLLFSKVSIESTFDVALENDFLGSLIALGAIANFFPFFVFLRKKQDYRARGVLIVSLFIAILIAILKFS